MPLFGKKNKDEALQTRVNSLNKSEAAVERLVWLGLKVADLMGESIFLEETLQLRFASEGNSGVGHHIRYNCGGIELELVEGGMTWASRPKPKNNTPDMPLVVSFVTDDVQAALERLKEREVPVTQIFDQERTASFLFTDPERNLWQAEEIRNAPLVGTKEIQQIGTIWLECEDLGRQIGFYRDLLRLPLVSLGGGVRPITSFTELLRLHPEAVDNSNVLPTERVTDQYATPKPPAEETTSPENAPEEAESPSGSIIDEEGNDVTTEEATDNATEETPTTTSATTNEADSAGSEEPVETDPSKMTWEAFTNSQQLQNQVENGTAVEALLLDTSEEIEASLRGENPGMAVFFVNGVHLALVAGGRKPNNVTTRVWGRDVSMLLSFRAHDFSGLVRCLQEGGYLHTAPTRDADERRGLSCTFSDPEGNIWQLAEWLYTPRL